MKLRWDDAIVKRNLARLGISTASGQASTGSVGDPFQQGFSAYKAKNYKLTLHYWAPLVRAGDVRAQLYVGFIYYRGLGVERNGKGAAALFGKAAKGRDPSAEMWVGVMFYNGDTVRKDKKKGIDLLFRAVRQGSNGAKGFAIKYTQKLLTERGYDPGPVDAKMGSRTRDAIAAYRRKANLAGDPVVDKPLLISLNTITHRAGSFTFTGKARCSGPFRDRWQNRQWRWLDD